MLARAKVALPQPHFGNYGNRLQSGRADPPPGRRHPAPARLRAGDRWHFGNYGNRSQRRMRHAPPAPGWPAGRSPSAARRPRAARFRPRRRPGPPDTSPALPPRGVPFGPRLALALLLPGLLLAGALPVFQIHIGEPLGHPRRVVAGKEALEQPHRGAQAAVVVAFRKLHDPLQMMNAALLARLLQLVRDLRELLLPARNRRAADADPLGRGRVGKAQAADEVLHHGERLVRVDGRPPRDGRALEAAPGLAGFWSEVRSFAGAAKSGAWGGTAEKGGTR